MGWLSLATKVLPQLWKAGAKATSTLWRGGSAVLGTSGKVLSAAARNPKTAVVTGIAAYAGWHQLEQPEESFGTSVGKTVRKGMEGSSNFMHDAVNGFTGEDTVGQVKDTTTNVLNDLKDTVTESKGILGAFGDTLKGIGTFLGNLLGGNGANMFANFFNNISNGHVSGLGIGGLIAAGYLLFGRTGLLGKIGGVLLAMMLIGRDSRQQTTSVNQEHVRNQAQEQHHGMHR